MNATPPDRTRAATLLSGVLGGLVVLVVGAVLIKTDVIDTGDTKREVVREQTAVTRPAANNDGGGRTVSDIYKREGEGVVFIQARGVSEDSNSPFGQPQNKGTATGSGLVVKKNGTILTNAHVVGGSKDVSVRFSEDDDPIDADVKGRDPSSDLAVLKIDPSKVKDMKVLPLGDSSKAQVGDPVVAIGNPFGFTRTVTTGIVSAVQRQIEAPNGFPIRQAIQTDASINPGNSGGPLLDSEGRVIGINSQIATGGSQGSVGIGFAIPINSAKSLLPRLEKSGTIERSYLGVEMTDITDRLAKDLKLPVNDGALVQTAVKGGPADKAGLRGGRTPTGDGINAGGDLIVKVAGKDVKNPDDVADAIADKKPGDQVDVEYYRGEDKKKTEVTLGKRPSTAKSQSGQGGGGGGGGDSPFSIP